ncbi:MAG: hypothetical protein PHH47_11220 [Gallionella sp.]|nr:hypothetical protein [Gallionella sp.]MDD4947011.1 hypothetical protein [Gallionella sp.]
MQLPTTGYTCGTTPGCTQSLAADLERLRAALADKAGQVERLQMLIREIDAAIPSPAAKSDPLA